MTRKIAIGGSIFFAIVFTIFIVRTAQADLRAVAETVDVVVITQTVHAGREISEIHLGKKSVPVALAGDWLTDISEAVGKIARVTLLENQFLCARALRSGHEKSQGNVGILVAVDLASSALALPPTLVDVHLLLPEEEDTLEEGAPVKDVPPRVITNIRVLRAVTSDGADVPLVPEKEGIIGGDTRIAAVMLEIPLEKAEQVVLAAAQNMIYLVRSVPETD